jgi:hypothetical protein
MKKLLLFLVFAGFLACENESIQELPQEQETSVTEGVTARENQKVDVCHKGNIISVSVSSLSGHQGHGDAVDMDGDGYFDIENDCSEVDCDDTSYSEYNLCVGDFYQGGIVFWLDETGLHGLVCAVSDAPLYYDWNDAISYCSNYSLTVESVIYNDWYLPNRVELKYMFDNKGYINTAALANGGLEFLPTGNYWSSTEDPLVSTSAYLSYFVNGIQYPLWKGNPLAVRAVRAF